MPDDKDKRASATTPGTDAAQAELGQPADTTTSDAPSTTATGSAKRGTAAPACPTCRGPLERYAGEAAHKLGSFWCHACGVRHRLPAAAAADEATASVSASGTKAAGAG